MTQGFRDFEFDLPSALLDHLVAALDSMEQGTLTDEGLNGVPEAQGVYQLFLDHTLVYIGKTDAEAGLSKRLARHSRKILHRQGLDPHRITFKAVRIFVFTAMDLETQLIRHYTGKDGTHWNGSGFGANDPGRERDTGRPGTFDREFPIDIDRPLEIDLSGTRSAGEIVARLKTNLPYTLRFQSASKGSRKLHPELENTSVDISTNENTPRSILTKITTQLPSGWQATALSGLIILYKENKDNYPNATILARS